MRFAIQLQMVFGLCAALLIIFTASVDAKIHQLKCDSGQSLTIDTTSNLLNYNWTNPVPYVDKDGVAYVFAPQRMKHKYGILINIYAYDFSKGTLHIIQASSDFDFNQRRKPAVDICM